MSQWRPDVFPANLEGKVPTGYPTTRAGGSGAPGAGAPFGPHTYVIGDRTTSTGWYQGNEDPYEPGVLGQSPMAWLGIYDTQPWLAQPGSRNNDWFREVQPVQGPGLTLRVRPIENVTVWADQNYGLVDTLRACCLSVIVGGFDSPDGQLAAFNIPKTPDQVASAAYEPNTTARMGPNIMPALCSHSVAEVDLLRWASGARFVCAWLWGFWAGIDVGEGGFPPVMDVQWSVWSQKPQYQWGPECVSWPIQSIPNGPYALTRARALFRHGPGALRGPSYIRYGVVNGGLFGATVEYRPVIGPYGTLANYAGPFDLFAVAALNTTYRVPAAVPLFGESHGGFWVGNTNNETGAGGPLILSVTRPSA